MKYGSLGSFVAETLMDIIESVDYVNKNVEGVHAKLGDKVHFEVKARLSVFSSNKQEQEIYVDWIDRGTSGDQVISFDVIMRVRKGVKNDEVASRDTQEEEAITS